jgi:hypothetical protein
MAEHGARALSKFEELKGKIPTLNRVMGITLLFVNIIFPRVGTMICACIGPKFDTDNLLVGILQLLLAACLIGWVWSIWWGIIILLKSTG